MQVKTSIPPGIRRYLKRIAGGIGLLSQRRQSLETIALDARDFWSRSKTGTGERDMSHWLGAGRWATEELWHSIGEEHFALYKTLQLLAGKTTPGQSMLEWGPGGGANAVRFAQEFSTVIGVDISQPNLNECTRQMASRGQHNFQAVLIDVLQPEDALAQVGTKIDFFLSTAVFQHFPTKEYGIRVTRIAYQLLRADGVALIQTRFDDQSELFRPKSFDYARNVTYFMSYPIDEYWTITSEIGFRPLAVVLNPKVNYAFYLLAKT